MFTRISHASRFITRRFYADKIIRVPKFPVESGNEGEIILWHVKVGDIVERNKSLVEIDCVKGNISVDAQESGIIKKISVKNGETVCVGHELCVIDTDTDTYFDTNRVKLSSLRLRIAERLKESQNTTASLTTFNEINLGPLSAMRNKYKDYFFKKT